MLGFFYLCCMKLIALKPDNPEHNPFTENWERVLVDHPGTVLSVHENYEYGNKTGIRVQMSDSSWLFVDEWPQPVLFQKHSDYEEGIGPGFYTFHETIDGAPIFPAHFSSSEDWAKLDFLGRCSEEQKHKYRNAIYELA